MKVEYLKCFENEINGKLIKKKKTTVFLKHGIFL